MDVEKLRELIQIFESAKISEIEIEEEGLKIALRKASAQPVYQHIPVPSPLPNAPENAPVFPASVPVPVADETPSQSNNQPEEKKPEDEGLVPIESPMVGVFYAAPAPGEPPFVTEGQQVEADQTVCIVEAMKLMNEVTAKFPCVIEKILVENAEPIEFGQALFLVRPLGE